MSSDQQKEDKNHAKHINWKRLWIGILIVYGIFSIFSLIFFPKFFVPNVVFILLFGLIILITFLWQKNKSKKQQVKEGTISKSVYWKRYWIALIIAYTGSSIVLIIFLKDQLMTTLILTIIFGGVLIVGYYIRIRPSMIVNKIVYTALGVTTIGFGLCFLYGVIGISRLLVHLGSWDLWLDYVNFGILLIIGGFLGYYFGKRRDFRLPYSISDSSF